MYSRPVAESELSVDLRSLLASRWRTPNQSLSLAARLWSCASVHATQTETCEHRFIQGVFRGLQVNMIEPRKQVCHDCIKI